MSVAEREVKEETGLVNFELLEATKNKIVPIDIDTHRIGYNEKLDLPEHFHFDFRYLFVIDKISKIHIDTEEMSDYKLIDINELMNDLNFGKIVKKIERLLLEAKTKSL